MSSYQPGAFGYGGLGYRSREQELSVGQFFNAVYSWMAVGLAVTATVAYSVAHYGLGLLNPGVLIGSFVVQMVLVVTIGNATERISANVATVLFVLYAAISGITLSVLFLIYTKTSIAAVFVETSALFAAMSVYGYVTKRDLTRIGSFLIMGLAGLIIASLVNAFVGSGMMFWIISYVGVAVFVGLTAFDTQRLKQIAIATQNNHQLASRMAVVGSLRLYLDFVNLFIYLLRVMNDRRQ